MVGTNSLEVATPSALTTLVDEKTSLVQAASLKRRKVTLPVGAKSPRRVAVSWTAVPTGPPGDGVATMEVCRFSITMVNVWHTDACTPLLAHTVVGPNVPAWFGMPVRMPPGVRVRPGGRGPLVTENVAAGSGRSVTNWWP